MGVMSILAFLFRSDTSTVVTCVALTAVLVVGFAFFVDGPERRRRRAGKHRKK